MDCRTARLLLDFARPRPAELEPADRADLDGHLADCLDCSAVFRAERRADEAIGRALRDVPVPDGLRGRILDCLAAQRDRWYQRRLIRLGVAAAAVVLVGWGAWTWLRPSPMDVNLDLFAEAVNVLPASAEEVDAAFRESHVFARAPRELEFNFALLARIVRADFQGRLVPVLEFRHGISDAWVYILDARHFNIDTIDIQRRGSGRFTVEAFPSHDRQFAYVIVYRGGPLEAFLRRSRPPAT